MNTFGTLVRALRLQKHFTLETLAKRIGTQKGYVSGWERGTVNPPRRALIERLAKALDLDKLDLQELALVEKQSPELRARLRQRLQGSNPLFNATVTPAQVVIATKGGA